MEHVDGSRDGAGDVQRNPSNSITLQVGNAPQIFTTNQQGFGQAAVLVAGTAIIAAASGAFPGSRPAAKGEYLSIYATGLGR
jgi:uncharacterized protein (TIGR03437 family)